MPEDPAGDAVAYSVAQRSFLIHVDTTSELADAQRDNFSSYVISNMREWPWYCEECASAGHEASFYAATLFDAAYAYGLALAGVLNNSNGAAGDYRDGAAIAKNSNVLFEGMSGTIAIGADGVRNAIYMMSAYIDANASLMPFVTFQVMDEGVVS